MHCKKCNTDKTKDEMKSKNVCKECSNTAEAAKRREKFQPQRKPPIMDPEMSNQYLSRKW